MTGSTTIGTLGRDASVRATALTIAALASIPILIASAPISPSTASICCTTSGVLTASHATTPSVFCAVIAVSALVP